MTSQTIDILGLMSGSSLDGLDIAHCRFIVVGDNIVRWSIVSSKTYPYSEEWISRLINLTEASALAYARTDVYFGYHMADCVNEFIKEFPSKIDYIASHGHTVFHEPKRGMTAQIGNGAAIAGCTGIDTICDFRTTDIALGGEGTPLAHIVDKTLFSEYAYCLNIGGIANITIQNKVRQKSFDICPANQILNHASTLLGFDYDDKGQLSKEGEIDSSILTLFNSFDYYSRPFPKSLGNTEIKKYFNPIIGSQENLKDVLATSVKHIANQIIQVVKKNPFHRPTQMLITGGGAFNDYLIENIQTQLTPYSVECVLPSAEIIDNKEALLIALLGLLRIQGKTNCYSDVTSAKKDSINGAIYRG